MNHTIAHLFSDRIVTALSHTLIHSLWQGALLSVLTGLIMTYTRKASSALRYNLLVAAMALFAMVITGTLIMEFEQGATDTQVASGLYRADVRYLPAGITAYPAGDSLSVIEIINAYLNRYAVVIVLIWLLAVCARCIQFAAGLYGVHQLRRKDWFSTGAYWEERLRQLGIRVGIKRYARLVESARTKIPLVIGHLKPLILVPVGMLASLPAEEVEAILLHELAHIRRADYLVNLLQSLLEIVLFFNPPVLWLSSLIRIERENCCDDIALEHSGKISYLKALVACGEYNQASAVYAMAMNRAGGGLKSRVTRIIAGKNLPMNKREKSLLAVCLITVGLFATAFAGGGVTKQTRSESDSLRTQRMIRDLVKDRIITSTDNLSFKIGTDEFVVNYQKQTKAVYQKYRTRYVDNEAHGSDDWVWYYHFNSKKYSAIVASKRYAPQFIDSTTGVFRGKLNQ